MDADFVEPLFLVKHGVPYDLAFQMDAATRQAHLIVFGCFEGGKWNWDRFCWEEQS